MINGIKIEFTAYFEAFFESCQNVPLNGYDTKSIHSDSLDLFRKQA